MQTDMNGVRPSTPAPAETAAYAPEFPPGWDDYRAARERALRRMRPASEPAQPPLAAAMPLR
jgi:hypothetical protein